MHYLTVVVVLLLDLHFDFFLFHSLVDSSIASKFFPHLLESWIILSLFWVIWPFQLIFVFSFIQNVSPVFLFKLRLNFLNILIGLIEDIDSLLRILYTSALSCCISTSSNLLFTNFSLTSPFSIIFCRSFFALKRGINYFLLFVRLNSGTFSAILLSI